MKHRRKTIRNVCCISTVQKGMNWEWELKLEYKYIWEGD